MTEEFGYSSNQQKPCFWRRWRRNVGQLGLPLNALARVSAENSAFNKTSAVRRRLRSRNASTSCLTIDCWTSPRNVENVAVNGQRHAVRGQVERRRPHRVGGSSEEQPLDQRDVQAKVRCIGCQALDHRHQAMASPEVLKPLRRGASLSVGRRRSGHFVGRVPQSAPTARPRHRGAAQTAAESCASGKCRCRRDPKRDRRRVGLPAFSSAVHGRAKRATTRYRVCRRSTPRDHRHPAIGGIEVRISLDVWCPAQIERRYSVIVGDLDGSGRRYRPEAAVGSEFRADVRIKILQRGAGNGGPGLLQKRQKKFTGCSG
jgi:hypothetical protein